MAGSRRVPEGPAAEPVVQRLRIRYAKRGRMRFTSARDFQRALERAVRRAGLPIAFTAGFHPHPRISYANAAPTGVASEAEYVELSLSRPVDPSEVVPVLDAALPDGLQVLSAADAAGLSGALADHLQASLWALRFRVEDGEPGLAEQVREAAAAVLAAPEVRVRRMMKQGLKQVDVRTAVVHLEPADTPVPEVPVAPGDVMLLATVLHTTPTVRPEELWTALATVGDVPLPRPVSTRLRQGPLRDGVVQELPDG